VPGSFLFSGERGALESLGATLIGETGGATLEIAAGDRSLTLDLDALRSAWRSLGERFASVADG